MCKWALIAVLSSCTAAGPRAPSRPCAGPGLEIRAGQGPLDVAVGEVERHCVVTARERHCALGCWYGGPGRYLVRVRSAMAEAANEVTLDGSEVQLEGSFVARPDGASLRLERWLPTLPGVCLVATSPATENGWQSLALVNRSDATISFGTINGALPGLLVRVEDDGSWARISRAPFGGCAGELTGVVELAPGTWHEVRTLAVPGSAPLGPGRHAHLAPYVAADGSTRVAIGEFVVD